MWQELRVARSETRFLGIGEKRHWHWIFLCLHVGHTVISCCPGATSCCFLEEIKSLGHEPQKPQPQLKWLWFPASFFFFLLGHDRFLWHVLASESTRQNNNFERKAHPQNSKRKNSSEWPITLPILFSGKNPWPWTMKLFPENSSIADWCRYAPKDRESLCALCSKPSQGQVLVELLFRCKLW